MFYSWGGCWNVNQEWEIQPGELIFKVVGWNFHKLPVDSAMRGWIDCTKLRTENNWFDKKWKQNLRSWSQCPRLSKVTRVPELPVIVKTISRTSFFAIFWHHIPNDSSKWSWHLWKQSVLAIYKPSLNSGVTSKKLKLFAYCYVVLICTVSVKKGLWCHQPNLFTWAGTSGVYLLCFLVPSACFWWWVDKKKVWQNCHHDSVLL